MRSFSCLVGSVLLAATVTLSAPALSQPVATGAEASQKADDLFHKGKALYQAAKVREAYEAYAGAWALKRSYDIAANLANTEMVLGMKRDAAEHLAYCSRNFPPSGSKALLDAIKVRFDEARKEVGAVVVKGIAADAALRMDGKEIGPGPFGDELYVEPGKHTVEVTRTGYEEARQAFDVQAGGTAVVEVSQKKSDVTLSVAPVKGTGVLSAANEAKGPNKAIVVSGVTVAGVALGVGVVLAVLASGKGADADSQLSVLTQTGSHGICQTHTSECDSIDAVRRARDSLANGASASFIGAGAVGLATLGYVLLTPKEKRHTGLLVLPSMAPGYGALSIVGAW